MTDEEKKKFMEDHFGPLPTEPMQMTNYPEHVYPGVIDFRKLVSDEQNVAKVHRLVPTFLYYCFYTNDPDPGIAQVWEAASAREAAHSFTEMDCMDEGDEPVFVTTRDPHGREEQWRVKHWSHDRMIRRIPGETDFDDAGGLQFTDPTEPGKPKLRIVKN